MASMPDLVPPQTVDQIARLERELQTRACRADEARLRELLAPDFVEIGASGRRWELESILAMLRNESTDPDRPDIEVVDLSCRALTPEVVQVFWVSQAAKRRARRTSIWCRRGDRWQQTYHQGTPLP